MTTTEKMKLCYDRLMELSVVACATCWNAVENIFLSPLARIRHDLALNSYVLFHDNSRRYTMATKQFHVASRNQGILGLIRAEAVRQFMNVTQMSASTTGMSSFSISPRQGEVRLIEDFLEEFAIFTVDREEK